MANQNDLMRKASFGSINAPQALNSQQNGVRPAATNPLGHAGQPNARSSQGFISFQATKPKAATPATKSYKVGLPAATKPSQLTKCAIQIPAKVTPVPLPPHVLAAMASSNNGSPHGQQGVKAGQTLAETNLSSGLISNSSTTTTASADIRPTAVFADSQVVPENRPVLAAFPKPDEMNSTPSYPLARPGPIQQTITNPGHVQEFADVPGSESMQFVEQMMKNLRRASLHEAVN